MVQKWDLISSLDSKDLLMDKSDFSQGELNEPFLPFFFTKGTEIKNSYSECVDVDGGIRANTTTLYFESSRAEPTFAKAF